MDLVRTLLPLLGGVVGALLTWFLGGHGRRDDRRREAWATWAEHAYRLMIVRRELIERCWQARRSPDSDCDNSEPNLARCIALGLRQQIERDSALHAALARVLLAEPSPVRRHQARAFTDLLSQDVEHADVSERALLESHDRYLAALQATLDELLGRYAESGTSAQVSSWFKEKYEALAAKQEPIRILEVGDHEDIAN
ncbi:MAG TPA: hypothetical protein VG963_04625 [Polyangiaceae bacterium]|nr:hypothetical protein [Polyangiaceae bacterium]